MKGLLLQVYRSPGVTTAGGLTNSLTVVGIKRRGEPITPLDPDLWSFDPTSEAPAVILVESEEPQRQPPVLIPLEYLDPVSGEYQIPEGQIGPTRSGSYAGATDANGMIDGRWSDLGKEVGFPMGMWLLPVHDRVESIESFQERKADHSEKVAASNEYYRKFWESREAE